MELIRASAARHAMRMARPLSTARGVVVERPASFIRLLCGEAAGYGEACPLPGFSQESYELAAAELERCARRLDGAALPHDLASVEALVDALKIEAASVRFAVESALLSLLSSARGVPLARLLDEQARARLEVNATIGAPQASACWAQAMEARAAGFMCFKLKVGALPLAEDVARARAVREAIGDAATLRVDANGAWSAEQAAQAIAALAPLGVALVEQPTQGIEELGALRRPLGPKIAADEAVRGEADALRALPHVDALVLKPALIGGLLRTLRIAQAAAACGVEVIITTLLDGAVGRAAALHTALAAKGVESACGLATGELLARDVAAGPRAVLGWMMMPEEAGLGVTPDVAWHEIAVPRPLRGTITPNPLVQRARWMPDHPALISAAGTWSYARLYEEARRVAAGLKARGVAAGEVVGVAAPASAQLVATLHGVSLAGCVIAALHPRLTGEEASRLAYRAGCALVIVEEAWREERALDEALCGAPVVGLSELVRDQGPVERVFEHVGLDEPHALLFTSGTTGTPKMAILTWGNQLFSAMGSAAALGHLPTDVWGAPLPLCHVGGLAILMRCALLGTTVRLYERFDAAQVADDLVSGAVTLVSLVSRMCWQVIEALGERRPAASARGALLGGGPIPPELLEACARAGLKVAPTYGMTEGCSQLVTGRFDEVGPVRTNVPIVWTELHTRAEDGSPGGDQGVGELYVRGPTVSPGYARARRPGEGLEVDEGLSRRAGGWFGTGDWVELGAGGLKVLDRRTDLIVSGGENVYPAEVEAALREHPSVADVCVVGLKDVEWGQRVAAVLVARGARASDAELEAHCRARLAGYKAPRAFRWWEELPRSSLDKISRAQVRERLARELDATRAVESP